MKFYLSEKSDFVSFSIFPISILIFCSVYIYLPLGLFIPLSDHLPSAYLPSPSLYKMIVWPQRQNLHLFICNHRIYQSLPLRKAREAASFYSLAVKSTFSNLSTNLQLVLKVNCPLTEKLVYICLENGKLMVFCWFPPMGFTEELASMTEFYFHPLVIHCHTF